ncbi:pentapeptide repeat-containing protein [Streptomyces sviceus]
MVTLIAASLPGFAALAALLFTWMQVGQTGKELRIAERGQITSRFNAAINNLGSQSLDRRLGGIYALERIMQDSVRDHFTIVSVLAAYVQQHAESSTKSLKKPLAPSGDTYKPPADVQAAVATLTRRRPERDHGTIIDLSYTDLRGLRFTGKASVNLPEVNLSHADLRWATLRRADLRKASLDYASLEFAELGGANFRTASLVAAKLHGANLIRANLRGAAMTCGQDAELKAGQVAKVEWRCVDLQLASLTSADLRNVTMDHADLREAVLAGADLRNADLSHADLRKADLTGADFRGATLIGVKLQGAERSGARGLPKEKPPPPIPMPPVQLPANVGR